MGKKGHEWIGLVASLIYPIQFSKDPNTHIDHVLSIVIERDDIDKKEYIHAIEYGLRQQERILSSLIPQPHSEETIILYLNNVLQRLKTDGGSKKE